MGSYCLHYLSEPEMKISKVIWSEKIKDIDDKSQIFNREEKLKFSKIEMENEKSISIDDFRKYINEEILKEEYKKGELNIPNEINDYLLNENLVLKSPIILSDNNIYYGEWDNNNKMSGKGELYIPKLNIYKKGIWKNDNIIYGRIYCVEGIYEGYIKENEYNGIGRMEYKNNIIYEGNWVKGLKDGEGNLTYSDGCKYIGNFKNNIKSGKGKFIWDNGDYYEGNFNNDIFNGEGYIKIKNGSEYKGNFFNGYFHGKGIFNWKNGDKYEGDYYYGKKEGKGIYIFNNGIKYNGEWYNNKPNKEGELEINNCIYKTNWKDGTIIDYSINENNNNENKDPDFNSLKWMIEDINIQELKHLNTK